MSFSSILQPEYFITYLAQHLGLWSYFIIFFIIFLECGCIFTPFLPGESMLFTLGAMAAQQIFYLGILISGLLLFAIAGYFFNYIIGQFLKDTFLKKLKNEKIIKYIDKTQMFYKKYGAKTLILGRCIPIVRTYAPFLAGLVNMSFSRFMLFNICGAFLWVLFFTMVGYLFGNIPWIKQHLNYAILIIILISIMPIVFEFFHQKQKMLYLKEQGKPCTKN